MVEENVEEVKSVKEEVKVVEVESVKEEEVKVVEVESVKDNPWRESVKEVVVHGVEVFCACLTEQLSLLHCNRMLPVVESMNEDCTLVDGMEEQEGHCHSDEEQSSSKLGRSKTVRRSGLSGINRLFQEKGQMQSFLVDFEGA